MIARAFLLAALAAPPPALRPAAVVLAQAPLGAREEAARLLGHALAGEPRVEAVQRAAAARAGIGRDEAEGWRRRARLAALVPRVSAQYRRDERSYRVAGLASTSEVDYVRDAPGETFSVRLDWNLEGLVLGREELAAAAAAQRAQAHRQRAVDRATHLYYERVRLRLALAASPPSDARERAEVELRVEEVTAELDALTGLYGEDAP
jgi:hypothetical protein